MSEKSPRIAVYAGSFDPPTNGHMYVIRQGAALFDQLVVVVAVNPYKQCLFKSWERVNMLRDLVYKAGLTERVLVVETDRYVGEVAKRYGAQYFFRGARLGGIQGETDIKYEFGVAELNHEFFPVMETILILSPLSFSSISSSAVKSLIEKGGDVGSMIDPMVEALTRLRMKKATEQSPKPE